MPPIAGVPSRESRIITENMAPLFLAAFCLLAGAPAAAVPMWPPPIAPVWPTQFSSPVTGFDNATSPSNFTGTFFYDWVNNALRYDSTPIRPGGDTSTLKPLPNSSRVWVAEPRPVPDLLAHIPPGIYQFNWDQHSCMSFPMPGLSVERPDSFVHVNATHKERVHMDGRWTDYW